jgi:hypothetical protein
MAIATSKQSPVVTLLSIQTKQFVIDHLDTSGLGYIPLHKTK